MTMMARREENVRDALVGSRSQWPTATGGQQRLDAS
jgi:hypothetical protein